MYLNRLYLIRNRTNLHVGSGDTNYGIIDKEVQRDTVTSAPVIHASSLKGAVRDHFNRFLAQSNETENESEVKPSTMKIVFGTEDREQGLVKFIDARLLFLPLRSDRKPFYHVTSRETIAAFLDFCDMMGIAIDIEPLPETEESYVVGTEKDVSVEDVLCQGKDVEVAKLKAFFGIENLAVFNDEDFNEALLSLPVIARNKLKDGKSDNLWYEEVVPRESIFYTVLCYYDNLNDVGADRRGKIDRTQIEKSYARFEKKLLADNIQIGANESIGYGVCRFSKAGGSDE